MPENKIAKSTKSVPRVFNIQIETPPQVQRVLEVIDSIENDKLMVFDAKDADALNQTPATDDSINLFEKATIPVSIKEWLCVSFQVIRWDVGDEFKNPKHYAVYKQNAPDVIYPVGTIHVPPGPAAFFGEIILRSELLQFDDSDKLSFVVAHELTHAIDMLRMLVPATLDWPAFWENVLEEGSNCEMAQLHHHFQSVFVDDYGSQNELATVAQYWPSRAEKWFKAFRG
jgi:hypothetical protein